MLSDLKYAFRVLGKTPAFSAVAILTLALGIGANSAIFSVVDAVLFRSLPFPNADRLVRLYEAGDDQGARGSTMNMSAQTLQQWREHGADIFEGIAAATGTNVTVGQQGAEPARNVQAARITGNFLTVLGLSPALGRNFTAEEDRPGGPAVALVSDDFWRSRLQARPDVLGSVLPIDGVPRTIVGVLPKSFRHPYRSEVWLPLALPASTIDRSTGYFMYGVGRLRPNLTVAQAEAAVRRMCAEVDRVTPHKSNPFTAYMPPLGESFVMDLRPKLLVIITAALGALLIAAANFAGLLMTRVVEREGEFALRAALGASRLRLIRQNLSQALVLAGVGTVAGLLLAWWATPALVAMSPEGNDATGSAMREFDYAVRLDWRVFFFATAVMLLVGFGFGLLPALRAARANLREAVSSTGRGATLDRGARRLLGSFVVVELAVAAALLISSLTAAQYFRKLAEEPWGFETKGRTSFQATFAAPFFDSGASKIRAVEAAVRELAALPGVESATVTSPSPMQAPRNLLSCNPEGVSPPERGYHLAYLRAASPGYFQKMHHPLLRGREFTEMDHENGPKVCLVTDGFARRFWPGQDPIGKQVKWGRLDNPVRPWMTVVGMVGDMKAVVDPRDGEVVGMIARPLAQQLSLENSQMDEMTFVVHRRDDHVVGEAALRGALARADSRVAAYEIKALDEAASQSRVTERFIFVLVSLFGALGLVLAAIGLYGLLSLQVARREREFGIRSALGATAAQLIALVTRQGAVLLGMGFAAGGLVTWGAIRIIQAQWSGMPGPNTMAWIFAALVLSAAAVLACWLPARRASRIDPVIALRAE